MQTLQEYFNPVTSFFTLQVVNGKLDPLPTEPTSLDYLTPSMPLSPSLLASDVPAFMPKDILIDWDVESDGAQFPAKVFGADQVPYHFKAAHHGSSEAITREIESLLRLEWEGPTGPTRVPRLCGYMQGDGDDGNVGMMGLLL
ncbi:uncharacterized protein BP5553_04677 [Venustampulla echinocandica]|uniref:Uncharacterized protein n=1 Tax=Venustampulla echinocandica TaxID=2656787 RepID=A0A370TNZ2_9HELO|nr:uncharacterized protein BP5553_04677 [Venustampulla echinocandica]RDL37244.1 hypothetical protein BP5553_04677 [Venustampulla echinocandica]